MSTRARWVSTRFPLPTVLILAVVIAISGCGGGGGGGGGTGGTGTGGTGTGGTGTGGTGTPPAQGQAAITGKVVDQSGAGVQGATIQIVGTSISTTSGSDGTFTTPAFADSATAFTVVVPGSGGYPSLVSYNSLLYNVAPTRDGGPCGIPLPKLASGTSVALPSSVELFNPSSTNSSSPPPPPVYGCQ